MITRSLKYLFSTLETLQKSDLYLTHKDAEMLAHAFITSRLDYCNSLFTGSPNKYMRKLQLVQNVAVSVFLKTKKMDHITFTGF